jgi:hypothetical protein
MTSCADEYVGIQVRKATARMIGIRFMSLSPGDGTPAIDANSTTGPLPF